MHIIIGSNLFTGTRFLKYFYLKLIRNKAVSSLESMMHTGQAFFKKKSVSFPVAPRRSLSGGDGPPLVLADVRRRALYIRLLWGLGGSVSPTLVHPVATCPPPFPKRLYITFHLHILYASCLNIPFFHITCYLS
jgi:hypothetical protein